MRLRLRRQLKHLMVVTILAMLSIALLNIAGVPTGAVTGPLSAGPACACAAVPVWERTRRYLRGAKVEWRAGSGTCYESNQITEGEEPPSTPWDPVAC